MPREKQKRGRRAEAKNKHDAKRKREDEETEPPNAKKPKPTLETQQPSAEMGDDYVPLDLGEDAPANTNETPFYGLLDSEEQEYFSHANGLLDLDQFDDAEARGLFIERVFEEANGKELKIACSQSCSRLMEKLIAMSTPEQAKRLFSKFSGHFLHLVQHRFASHCCEALFCRSAPIVSSEKKNARGGKTDDAGEDTESDFTAEDLILGALSELEGNWGYLLTERFASHTIRILLLVLAGEPFDSSSNISVVASRKKENLDSARKNFRQDDSESTKRPVPDSFKKALDKMMKDLVSGLDDTYLRALATHPTGSPVLQVLLSIELTHMGKARGKAPDSLLRKLFPDESFSEDDSSATFVRGLLYDPVGSRLLETVIRCAPGKIFKSLFKNAIRDRIGALSRNDVASYVVVRALERLSKEDLQSVMNAIIPECTALVERSRLIVIKALIERCVVRGADTTPLADALRAAYPDDAVQRLNSVLKLEEEKVEGTDTKPSNKTGHSPEQVHGSLLAQAMLKAPGSLADLIQSSLTSAPQETIIRIAKHSTASHVLQDALSLSTSPLPFRRQFVPRFFGKMTELALDPSGSHVADTLWPATKDLTFLKQTLAEELADNERTLRDSFFGRAVWRNWSMDLYKRRRGEWLSKAKGLDGPQANSDASGSQPKSKIELARARFAAKADKHKPPKSNKLEVTTTS